MPAPERDQAIALDDLPPADKFKVLHTDIDLNKQRINERRSILQSLIA